MDNGKNGGEKRQRIKIRVAESGEKRAGKRVFERRLLCGRVTGWVFFGC
jgi:hypothetical protein